jgi:hypothetical protein
VRFIGQDGNIFNLMGIVLRTLRRNGRSDLCEPFKQAVTSSHSYQEASSSRRKNQRQPKAKQMMKANETHHEMSLQEKAICLALTGRKPELPYQLKEVECDDGTVQRIYQIPDADKSRVLSDLFPMSDGPDIDDTIFDLHERKTFKVRDFLVIRWREGNLLASPYFPRSGGMLVDWITPEQAKAQGTAITLDVKVTKPRSKM